jgi:hypothetical protein
MPRESTLQHTISFVTKPLKISNKRRMRRSTFPAWFGYGLNSIYDLRKIDLSSIIQNNIQQPLHHSSYLKIAQKCLEENTAVFLEDIHICYYEKGQIMRIKDVPDAKERISQIQRQIKKICREFKMNNYT